MKDLILGMLIIIVIVLGGALIFIWNTDYEFCWTDGGDSYQCNHQKIGDYLLGKE